MSGLALKFGEDTQALLLYTYDSECGVTGKTEIAPGESCMVNKNRDHFLPSNTAAILLFCPISACYYKKGTKLKQNDTRGSIHSSMSLPT